MSDLIEIPTICSNQISYLYKKDQKPLLSLICRNLKKVCCKEEVEEIINKCKDKSDNVIYSTLRENIKKGVNYTKKERKWGFSRESSRRKDIFKFYKGSPKKYLDIGGGNGSITSEIGKSFLLKEEDIICVDINKWLGKTSEKKYNISYKEIKEDGILPFNDGEFSLITLFQSLHHMKNVDKMISEIFRVLHPGGYIIIREHDCSNDNIKLLIDIEHCLFEKVLCEGDCCDFEKNYYGEYKSKEEWNSIFTNNGLKLCDTPNIKKNNNHTNYYYGMYYKE